MRTSFAPLTSSEIYQGCRTPSDLSVFSVSSPGSSLGPCPSATEIYQGLRTPDWSELSQRSSDSEYFADDEYPSAVNPRTMFTGFSSASSTGLETDRRGTAIGEASEEDPATVPALEVYAQNGLTLEICPHFSYDEIVQITNGFQNVFGRGKYGIVYPGQMIDGTMVAVKMYSTKRFNSTKFYHLLKLQAQLSMRLEHKNLISIVGQCYEGNRMCLILEYMPRGNLRRLLQGIGGNKKPLSWVQRIQIALDVAEGLEYLHGCKPPMIHGNIKMANILLDESLEAKLTDFWFSKVSLEYILKSMREEHSDDIHPAVSGGFSGDLEYYDGYQFYQHNDVYQFGLVLWELITGQPARMHSIPNREKSRLVDPRLHGNYDANSACLARKIALSCRERKRVTMSEVVAALKICLALDCCSRWSLRRVTFSKHGWCNRFSHSSLRPE